MGQEKNKNMLVCNTNNVIIVYIKKLRSPFSSDLHKSDVAVELLNVESYDIGLLTNATVWQSSKYEPGSEKIALNRLTERRKLTP